MYTLQPYDDLLAFILKNGVIKDNRTGIQTLSVFGTQARYRIDTHFPVLTKRKMYPSSIFKELLWILSGSTNVKDLEAMGSKIWSAWRDEKFEQDNDYMEGDLGPIYGHQLRHFGLGYNRGTYLDAKGNKKYLVPYQGGVDQISYVLNELKTNKSSRRILFSYWNPIHVSKGAMRLPPCHMTCIFNVDSNDNLSALLLSRSGDFPIGVPANIQFYSALLYMIGQQLDLNPYELIHTCADSHIYLNQVDAVEEYLSRAVIDSPILKLNKAANIFSYKPEDFVLENYNPAGPIKMEVAV